MSSSRANHVKSWSGHIVKPFMQIEKDTFRISLENMEQEWQFRIIKLNVIKVSGVVVVTIFAESKVFATVFEVKIYGFANAHWSCSTLRLLFMKTSADESNEESTLYYDNSRKIFRNSCISCEMSPRISDSFSTIIINTVFSSDSLSNASSKWTILGWTRRVSGLNFSLENDLFLSNSYYLNEIPSLQ